MQSGHVPTAHMANGCFYVGAMAWQPNHYGIPTTAPNETDLNDPQGGGSVGQGGRQAEKIRNFTYLFKSRNSYSDSLSFSHKKFIERFQYVSYEFLD